MKDEKGITLIALIITIIILVILAMVTSRAAFNSGIIDYSIEGTQKYVEGEKRERRQPKKVKQQRLDLFLAFGFHLYNSVFS